MSTCLFGPAGTYENRPSLAVAMRPLLPIKAKLCRSSNPAHEISLGFTLYIACHRQAQRNRFSLTQPMHSQSQQPQKMPMLVSSFVMITCRCWTHEISGHSPSLSSARNGGEPWYSQPPQKTTMSAGYTVPSLVVTPFSLTRFALPRACFTWPCLENSK